MPDSDAAVLPIEVFAAKDASGNTTGVMLSVPCRCGLKQADTLRIDQHVMLAIRNRSVLPIDLPRLTEKSRSNFFVHANAGHPLPVAELTALGLLDAYFLKLEIVR